MDIRLLFFSEHSPRNKNPKRLIMFMNLLTLRRSFKLIWQINVSTENYIKTITSIFAVVLLTF